MSVVGAWLVQRHMAMGHKVFWGGAGASLASPPYDDGKRGGQQAAGGVMVLPNPLLVERSAVWRRDLCFHACNRHWLASLALADPVDRYSGPWGHRAALWSAAMLLFLLCVLLAISSFTTARLPLVVALAGRGIHTGGGACSAAADGWPACDAACPTHLPAYLFGWFACLSSALCSVLLPALHRRVLLSCGHALCCGTSSSLLLPRLLLSGTGCSFLVAGLKLVRTTHLPTTYLQTYPARLAGQLQTVA